MSNLILRNFSLTRDFRSVAWGSTLRYNLMRAAAAGVVWAVFIFIMSVTHRQQGWSALEIPLLLPLAYLIMGLPLGLVLSIVGRIFPIVGLVGILFAFEMVTVGDPLICILYALAPQLIPVQRPPFHSLALIYFVLKPEETDQIAVAS